jgi:SpoIID/LytB domain protein
MLWTPVPAQADASVPVGGHGWGHGRGLGQYGAYGYSQMGWTGGQILDHFYGGTAAGTLAPGNVSVRLDYQTGSQLTVWSGIGAGMYIAPYEVATQRAVKIVREADGRFHAFVSLACGGAVVWDWYTDGTVLPIGDPGDDLTKMLTVCGADGQKHTYRGSLKLVLGDGSLRTVNTVPMEQYLRSVVPSESPSSWPAAALQAQAVAARSYAGAEGGEFGQRYSYAKTCDSTFCQVYSGAAVNGVRREYPSTDAAIAATAGVVRRFTSNGVLARTEFSSSTGGWTDPLGFPAVVDDGDATPANPNHNWSTSIPASTLSAVYGIGTFQRIIVTARNGYGEWGGRVVTLQIQGTAKTVTVSGDAFKSTFGLKSNWFDIGSPFLTWALRNSATPGAPDVNTVYGSNTDTAIACDWDGNGSDTLGVYVNGAWYLRNSTSGGLPDVAFAYGAGGYTPVCGDWDGNGTDTVGVYADGNWFLRNSNTPGPPDIVLAYGYSGATPLVGNWNGADGDGIGVYDAGAWYMRNAVTPGLPDIAVNYGAAGYTPVPGDWDGNGTDTLGVYATGNWFLRNSNLPGMPVLSFAYGAAADRPITGDWNADGATGPGVTIR